MLRSFHDEITEEVFNGIHTHAIRQTFLADQLKKIEMKLDILNAIESLEDLKKIPEHQDENAVRDVHGTHSIPIDDKYRITFRFNHDGVEDVQINS